MALQSREAEVLAVPPVSAESLRSLASTSEQTSAAYPQNSQKTEPPKLKHTQYDLTRLTSYMSKGLEDGVSAETTSRRAEVTLYARVSTSDKKQDLQTQLMALRDFVRIQASETHWEYVDQAPANDMAHQIARRKPLDASAKKRPQRGAGLQAGPGLQKREARARYSVCLGRGLTPRWRWDGC